MWWNDCYRTISGRYTTKIKTAARKENGDESRVRMLMKRYHCICSSASLIPDCIPFVEIGTVRKLVDRKNKLEQRFRKLRLNAFDVGNMIVVHATTALLTQS
jgi:hypothetical protein